MPAEFPDFRLGNVLATSFTATLTERRGDAVERIPTPRRLIDWLAVNGLAVDSCTTAQLELAWALRESIHSPRQRPRSKTPSLRLLSKSSTTAASRVGRRPS